VSQLGLELERQSRLLEGKSRALESVQQQLVECTQRHEDELEVLAVKCMEFMETNQMTREDAHGQYTTLAERLIELTEKLIEVEASSSRQVHLSALQAELDQAKTALEESTEDFARRFASLSEVNDELTIQLARAEEELSAYKSDISDTQCHFAELNGKYNSLVAEMDAVQLLLSSTVPTKNEEEGAASVDQHKLSHCPEQGVKKQSLIQQLSDMRLEQQRATIRIHALSTAKHDLEMKLADCLQRMQKQADELTHTKLELKTSSEQLDEAKERLADYHQWHEEEMEELTMSFLELTETNLMEREDANIRYGVLMEELTDATVRFKEAEESCEFYQECTNLLKANLLKTEHTDLSSCNESVQGDLDQLRASLEETTEALEAESENKLALEAELKEKSDAIDEWESRCLSLEEALSETRVALVEAETKLYKLTSQKSSLDDRLANCIQRFVKQVDK